MAFGDRAEEHSEQPACLPGMEFADDGFMVRIGAEGLIGLGRDPGEQLSLTGARLLPR